VLQRIGFVVEETRSFTPIPWWEYQIEMLLRPPQHGRAHPYFEKGESLIHGSRIWRRLVTPMYFAMRLLARPVNGLGLGESLLVTARKR
jgi:hypothetical protein